MCASGLCDPLAWVLRGDLGQCLRVVAVAVEVLAGDLAEDSGEGLKVLFLFPEAGAEQDFVDVVAGYLGHAFGADDQGGLVAAGCDGVMGCEDRGGTGGAGVLVPGEPVCGASSGNTVPGSAASKPWRGESVC
jgi:hypothetical protein